MNTLFPAVVNAILVSFPLAAAVWLALRLTRRSLNSATRYGVWWMAMLISASLPLFWLPRAVAPVALPKYVTHATRVASTPAVLPPMPAGRPIVHPQPKAVSAPLLPIRVDAGSVPFALACLWVGATLLTLFRLAVSLIMLQVRKSRAVEATPELQAAMNRSLARCGVRRRARIALVDRGASPLVAGPFRPCVLVPARLLDTLSESETEQICLHEAAHLARFDDCALLFQRLIEALFAVHPVVRWISRRIDLEREIACDDFVVALTGEARSYASCLTHVAEMAQGFAGSPVAAAVADESAHLDTRIDMLLNKTRCAGTRVLKVRFGVGLAGLALLTWIVGSTPAVLAIAKPISAPRQVAIVRPTPQIALLPQTAPAPRPQSKPAPVRQMQIPVTVTDESHRFVTGLDASAFHIFEDGVEQRVTAVREADPHVSLAIIHSTRGIDERIAEEESALLKALQAETLKLQQLRQQYKDSYPDIRKQVARIEEIRSKLVDLASAGGVDVQHALVGQLRTQFYEQNPPLERDQLTQQFEQRIRELEAEQQAYRTHSNDYSRKNIRYAIDEARSNPGKTQAIVVEFSVEDNSLVWPENELHAMIQEATVPIYGISVGTGSSDLATVIELLAEATGGRILPAANTSEIPSVIQKINIELSNRYLLSWASRSPATPGTWHRIEVKMTPPRGLPLLEAHVAPGYYEK